MERREFKDLFLENYSALCNMAFRITHDMERSEDVVMDVFEKAWNERDRLDPAGNIRSYIFTMVKNRALGMLRQDAHLNKVTGEMAHLTEGRGNENMEEEEIEKWLLIDRIYVSIRQLPPKCAEVFTLGKINGLTYVQIAEQMNISVKTVENQMGKALRMLREILSHKL